MNKLNTYAYLHTFDCKAKEKPIYHEALTLVTSRDPKDIPLKSVYKFKLFDSKLDFDNVDAIIQDIKNSSEAKDILKLLNQSFDLMDKYNNNGNNEVAKGILKVKGPLLDLYNKLCSIDNLEKYTTILNITKWYLIGNPINNGDRQKKLNYYGMLKQQDKYDQILNSDTIISSGLDNDYRIYFPEDNWEHIYPTETREQSRIPAIQKALKFKYYK